MSNKNKTNQWIPLFTLTLLFMPNAVFAQPESWVGKTILVKKPGIKIGYTDKNGKQVYLATLIEPDYVVRAENEGWLKVRTRKGVEGWLDKDDAVPVQDAVDYFTNLISKKAPPDATAHWYRGVAWRLKNDRDAALRDFAAALRLQPKLLPAYVARGSLLMAGGDFLGAMKDFDEAVRLGPNNSLAFLARGQAWQVNKEHDKAIKDFSEAIRNDPADPGPLVGRGLSWDAKKDFDQAIKDFSAAIRLDPSNAEIFSHRALAFHDKKDFDQAIKDFNEAIRLEPKNAVVHCDRGDTWQAKKDFAMALQDYSAAMNLDPKSAHACNQRAWILATCTEAKFRDGKKAVELARKAVELSLEKEPVCFDTLGAAHAENGDFDEAVRWQLRALADESFVREFGEPGRQRLELYRNKKPFRE